MSRFAMVLSLAMLMVSSLACSKGGILNIDRGPSSSILQQVGGAEFVSSSAQYENTLLNNYHVQQSVGDFLPTLEQTSANGYKLYSTVQGQMLSQ
jgi:hypothetical protein